MVWTRGRRPLQAESACPVQASTKGSDRGSRRPVQKGPRHPRWRVVPPTRHAIGWKRKISRARPLRACLDHGSTQEPDEPEMSFSRVHRTPSTDTKAVDLRRFRRTIVNLRLGIRQIRHAKCVACPWSLVVRPDSWFEPESERRVTRDAFFQALLHSNWRRNRCVLPWDNSTRRSAIWPATWRR